jgi:cobalt/nickel transport system permease protein
VGAGHQHTLFHETASTVHRLAPEAKVVAGVAFVLAVAVTPRTAPLAFALHALALIVVVLFARLPAALVLRRLTVVVPFAGFALVVPFVAGGEQVDVMGVALSRDGLWSAFAVVAKAVIGATVSIILAATTERFALLRGLGRLRVPAPMVTIATFMLRYLELLAGELARMRRAMTSRGYTPRWLWHAGPAATAAGAIFIRSYERGERVHAAMLARGFTGTMPDLDRRRAHVGDWAVAALLPLAGAGIATAALLVGR